MIIASAQTIPKDGDIEANLNDHLRLAARAADNGAQLIVFPELSLTGYEREKAPSMAFNPNDERLHALQQLSIDHNIIIIAGAPIKINNSLHIGAFILSPDSPVSIYTKQFLHTGEEIAFSPSFDFNPLLHLDGEKISLAICADIANPLHPENASKKGTTLYIAGIYYTPAGIAEGHKRLSTYAQNDQMAVLMANYGGPSYKYEAGGKSAFWTSNGQIISQLKEDGEGLLIMEGTDNSWTGREIYTNDN